jgi:hypothetical protein
MSRLGEKLEADGRLDECAWDSRSSYDASDLVDRRIRCAAATPVSGANDFGDSREHFVAATSRVLEHVRQ